MSGAPSACAVVELRRYTLHPGARETLVELFDREFVEPQEAVGMAVLGQFRDLDDPDAFVWLRGFADMAARRQGLEAFYGGPVWRRHRDAANATMVDSDDVLLLQPQRPLVHEPARRPAAAGRSGTEGVHIAVHHVAPGGAGAVAERIAPLLDPPPLACLVTEHAANDFPALPVREDVEVVVTVTAVADPAAPGAGADLPDAAAASLVRPAETFRLAPTGRSALP